MTDKAKTVYTDEVVADMVEQYTSVKTDAERADAVVALAESLGVGVASVRAKLVSEKVYVKPTPVGKTGEKPETKEQIVASIEARMGAEVGDLESLEKATKTVLKRIREAIPEVQAESSE
jgi:hypothetical protein